MSEQETDEHSSQGRRLTRSISLNWPVKPPKPGEEDPPVSSFNGTPPSLLQLSVRQIVQVIHPFSMLNILLEITLSLHVIYLLELMRSKEKSTPEVKFNRDIHKLSNLEECLY